MTGDSYYEAINDKQGMLVDGWKVTYKPKTPQVLLRIIGILSNLLPIVYDPVDAIGNGFN